MLTFKHQTSNFKHSYKSPFVSPAITSAVPALKKRHLCGVPLFCSEEIRSRVLLHYTHLVGVGEVLGTAGSDLVVVSIRDEPVKAKGVVHIGLPVVFGVDT